MFSTEEKRATLNICTYCFLSFFFWKEKALQRVIIEMEKAKVVCCELLGNI